MSEDQTIEFIEYIKNIFEYINTSTESIKIWDKTLKYATLRQAKKCFDEYVLTSNRIPKPFDIYQIWKKYQGNEKIEQIEIRNETYCELCGNIGLVKYYREHKILKENYFYEYFCQCICNLGKKYENIFPKVVEKFDLQELRKNEGKKLILKGEV